MNRRRAMMMGMLGGGNAVNPLASVPWVSQWKFNNVGIDSIGTNNLTNNGVATFTDGKLGGSTGATQLVKTSTQFWSKTSNSGLQTGNVDFMLCGWFYADTAHIGEIITKGTVSIANSGEYRVITLNSGATVTLIFTVANAAGTTKDILKTGLSVGAWHLFVVWHDSTLDTVNMVVDNVAVVPVDTGGLAVYAGNDAVYIGYQTQFGSYFNGRVDDIGFAKGAGSIPTQAVLDALWNGGNGTENFT